MKTTPQSVRRRGNPPVRQPDGLVLGRACRNSLSKQQKETKVGSLGRLSEFFASFGIFCFIAVSVSLVSASSFAQTPDSVAEREVQRRQAGISQGEAALVRGQAAMKAKDYAAAHEEFRTAVLYLPDAVVSGKAHDEAVDGFCKSGVVLAEARIAEGRYADAEAILSEILSDRYDPKCRPAQELYAHLRQPGYFNKTMSPAFIEKVEQVKQLLAEADGFYNSGRYDLAFKRYEQVLAIDPYNTAARRGQEKINNTKYKYGVEAYNETRSRQLWQVEKAWEQPVRKYGQTVTPLGEAFARDTAGTARINNKLNTIIIPRIEFRDASIREAIDFLREQAADNDPSPTGKRGVDIVLRTVPLGQVAPPPVPVVPATSPVSAATGSPGPAGTAAAGGTQPVTAPPVVARPVVAGAAISPAEARITITLNQIPLGEALRYIAAQAGLKVKVEPYAVSIIPISEQSNDLITKEYRVPPDFISTTLTGASLLQKGAYTTAPGTAASPGAAPTGPAGTGKDTQESTGGRQLVGREGARDFLESQGVQFPQGASAQFLPQSSRLIVRNTQDNLDLVDAIVEQLNLAIPKQVEIESKFIEITQNNLKELGFDWLLGPFNIGGHKIFGSGGTSGDGVPFTASNFPVLDANGVPVAGPGITFPSNGSGTAPGGTGGGPVTAGNRSGTFAISANALDALLFPGASGVAPGIFGLAGVFTDPQFQVVIRALNQKKGVDLLSAPKVTTKSGQRAIIEIVREFRYPTTFTPPQVPSITGGVGGTGTVSIEVVTPTTPQTFETRNTGVTLEVEPVVGPDGTTIDLNLVPQVVEFEGFINYGSPIFGVNPNLISGSTVPQVLLTENVINQPVFSTRKVTTNVSVWDGQTVVLGGLMREDVQKTEDKTPIVGDIPLVGRLFRTNAEQHIKRNLIIFVTARLVTPGGQPLNAEEEEEGLLPPALPETPAYKK
jgi:general secretion pathway protein D